MLTVKEIKELEELIKLYRNDENLIRLINLTHLLNHKEDDSVLKLKELIILGKIAQTAEKKED